MKINFFGINGSIHSAESGNMSFLVQSQQTSILVDCSGNPAQSLLLVACKPKDLDAIILTHAHIDHIYALPSLLHNLWLLKRKKTLTIFAEKSTLIIAQRLCAVFELEQKKGIFPIKWGNITDKSIQCKDITLTPFDLAHNIPTKGLILVSDGKKVVYFADTKPLTKYPLLGFDAEILIHECGGTEENTEKLNKSGHSNARQAAEVAIRLRAKNLFLCHLPPEKKSITKIKIEARQYCLCPVSIPTLFSPYMV